MSEGSRHDRQECKAGAERSAAKPELEADYAQAKTESSPQVSRVEKAKVLVQ